jgi:hypothetical protein
MIALKGKGDIGDKANTQIIAPLVEANVKLSKSDFNDPSKLGELTALEYRRDKTRILGQGMMSALLTEKRAKRCQPMKLRVHGLLRQGIGCLFSAWQGH